MYIMRILVLGHCGWIGLMVVRLLEKESFDYVTTDIRPDNKWKFKNELVRLNVSHVFYW